MILANGKRLESAMQDTVLDGLEERLNETLLKPAPTAEAVIYAIDELGLEGITILAIDNNDDTVQYVKDGRIWATMAQNFYKMGYQSATAAYQYLQGEEVDPVYDSGTVLITAENADTYSFD